MGCTSSKRGIHHNCRKRQVSFVAEALGDQESTETQTLSCKMALVLSCKRHRTVDPAPPPSMHGVSSDDLVYAAPIDRHSPASDWCGSTSFWNKQNVSQQTTDAQTLQGEAGCRMTCLTVAQLDKLGWVSSLLCLSRSRLMEWLTVLPAVVSWYEMLRSPCGVHLRHMAGPNATLLHRWSAPAPLPMIAAAPS